MPAEPRHYEALSVRHLVDLGYVDPDETAAHEAARRRQLDTELRHAVGLISKGHATEAIDELNRLATQDPSWISPRMWLAEVHFSAGYAKAARSQLDWLELHTVTTPRLATIAGSLALARRDFDSAARHLEYAAHQNPHDPAALDGLATVALHRGEFEEAAHWALKALECDLQFSRAHYHLGIALAGLNRHDAACEAFNTFAR